MNTPKRYHPISVILHWLTVLFMLGAGFLSESEGRSPISIHMILGAGLLITMILRVIFRYAMPRPARVDTGNKLMDKIGELTHLGLYLGAFAILGLGGLIAYNRNLFAVALGTGGVTGRAGFIGSIHHLGWLAAMALILLHVGAAFYHQIILKDNLMGRMWFGKS